MTLWNKFIISFLLLPVCFMVFADTLSEKEPELIEPQFSGCTGSCNGLCTTPEQRAWYEQQYDQYIKRNPVTPLKRHRRFTVNENRSQPVHRESAVKSVLVLINESLYSDSRAKEKIDRYMDDICRGHGCKVNVEVLEGGTDVEIKNLIKQYYTNDAIDGVIQIGSLTPAWYFDPDPQGGNFTCDLFYMDLDGTWLDKDNNGKYDDHQKGSGDRGPEVFYGRIDPATMGNYGSEVDLLCSYLDKNHAYWLGEVPLRKSALAYIEKDWVNFYNPRINALYGEENLELRWWDEVDVSRSDYVNNRLTGDYSFIHMWCHSNHQLHAFTDGGTLDHATIRKILPKPVGYAHDGCHCGDWAAGGGRGFLAGAYVYNESPTAMVCISGTKTGNRIGDRGDIFFEELGKNTCVGMAYKNWFSSYIATGYDWNPAQFVLWEYGYVIIGDPMIRFQEAITEPFVTVSSPNGGEKIEQYTTLDITWGDNISDNVKIDLHKAGSFSETIVASTESDGSYEWLFPGDMATGSDYTIVITSVDDGSLTDESNADFSITAEFLITDFPYEQNFDDWDTSIVGSFDDNWVQLGGDDLEWSIWTGPTPSKIHPNGGGTGPDGDHTGSGNYIYVEASGDNFPSKSADIISPKFSLNSVDDPQLSLWLHMFDREDMMGTLSMDIHVDGTWHENVKSWGGGGSDEWFIYEQDLSKYKGDRVQFRFRGVTGTDWASDICIDDFMIEGVTPIGLAKKSAANALSMTMKCSRLNYAIPPSLTGSDLTLDIFDLSGKRLLSLKRNGIRSGTYALDLSNGRASLASGMYIVKMRCGDRVLKKSIFLRR